MNEALRDIGFDEKETEIYLALLKTSRGTVSELLKHTGIERRTIYDVLERLVQKGRVSYFEENSTRTYQAIAPEIILEDIKEKQHQFQAIIPRLHQLKASPQHAKVEILKGVKGLMAIFHEIVAGSHEHLAFGDISPFINDEKYKLIVKKFLLQLEENKLGEKIIYAKGDEVKKIKKGEYRAIEKSLIPPAPTIIYGDVVTQVVFTNPLTIIKTTSKELAETHRQYFEHFWKLAK